MSDIIDLTGASSKKKATKTAPKAKAKAKAKKAAPKAATKKKAKAVTRARYTEDSITAPVRKAFASWKKGEQSLADVVRTLKADSRNAIWIQFRVLAGGTEDALHKLRAAGAGVKRGKLRFGTKTKSKKAKGSK